MLKTTNKMKRLIKKWKWYILMNVFDFNIKYIYASLDNIGTDISMCKRAVNRNTDEIDKLKKQLKEKIK